MGSEVRVLPGPFFAEGEKSPGGVQVAARKPASIKARLLFEASFPGDVAQLVEHLLCKQGVVGSIPIVSTRAAVGVKNAGKDIDRV